MTMNRAEWMGLSNEEAKAFIDSRGISSDEVDQCWHCHQSGCDMCHDQGYIPMSVSEEENS